MDNERSEGPERSTAFVARELRHYDINIAALQETRRAGEGQLTEAGAGYTFFWKGKEENEQRIHGVGFAIKNDLVKKLEELPVGINERLMTLRIKLSSNEQATVISAYAPPCWLSLKRKRFSTLHLTLCYHRYHATTKSFYLVTSMIVLAEITQCGEMLLERRG